MTDPRPPTRGERAVSWAKAISLTVATGLALYAAVFKGEPGADEAKTRVDQTWSKMRDEVNRLTKAYNRLHLRVIYFQGREEGSTSGALQAKIDQLQRKLDHAIATRKPIAKGPSPKPIGTRPRDKPTANPPKPTAKRKATVNADQLPQMPAPPPWHKK